MEMKNQRDKRIREMFTLWWFIITFSRDANFTITFITKRSNGSD
jgi:hypothetical protein